MRVERVMRNTLAVFCLVFLFIFDGCVILRNATGSSISVLWRVKDYAQSEIFDYGIDDCFEKVLAFAKKGMEGTDILKIDRRKYAILLLVSKPTIENIDIDGKFEPNNADVVIFFTREDDNKTKVEINSLSSIFVEYTAEKIFAQLAPPQQAQEVTEPEEVEEPEE